MKNYIIIALSILVVILYLLKGCNKPIPQKEIVIRTTDTIYKSDTIINYIEKKHTNLTPTIIIKDTSFKHDRIDLSDTSVFWSTYIYKIKDSLLEATISAYSETRPQIDLSYKLKSFQINDTILIKDSVYKELRIDKNKLYLGSEMVVSPLLSQAYIGASFEHKRGHLFNLDLGYDFNNQQRLIKVGYKRKLKTMEKRNELSRNTKEKGRKTTRQRVFQDEIDIINKYRRIHNESVDNGLNPNDVKHGWIKNDNSSLFFKNPTFKTEDKNKFRDDLLKDLRDYSPKFPKLIRNKSKESYGLVIDPADIHIGKLCTAFETGTDYNQQIAVKRVKDGVKGILDKSSGFNIDKIIFIGGNDILHTDTPQRRTTSGTPQDTDGMWYDNFLMAKQLYVDLLEMLISVADVHFTYNPSNHDYTNGFFLADVIQTYFRNCKNITFDCSINHRKYTMYGNSLIGTTHGDGAKQADLGQLMSVEAKEHWAKAEHRYFYTHHVHHKTAKDYINVTVESLRSPSPADSWHHRNGYVSKAAIEGFIHCKENGQICRITHLF